MSVCLIAQSSIFRLFVLKLRPILKMRRLSETKGGCVAFVLNLLESDGGGLVLLQFHDVDIVGRLYKNVYAAVGCMPFDIDIYARCSVVLSVPLG